MLKESSRNATALPLRKAARSEAKDRINRSLNAAIEEADRVGYVSAEESRQRVREVLKRIDQRAASGQIKP